MWRWQSWAVLSSVAIGACHGETAEARRAEAGRMAEAIRMLRTAPNDGKRPLLMALRQTSCSASDLCALRKRCDDGYTLQLSATDGIAAVRRAIGAPDRFHEAEAATLLTRSEGELHRAVELTRDCADGEAELRRRFSL